MGNIARKLPQHSFRHLQGTNKSQAKAQTNAPAVVNTHPVTPKATPKIVKLPIKTEKKKDSKMSLSGTVQQPQKAL